MTLPDRLDDWIPALYTRSDKDAALHGLASLKIDPASDFARFFIRYEGPFGYPEFGHEFLDLVSQTENILSSTRLLQEHHHTPAHLLVISTMVGLSVLVYDVSKDHVYDADFEGGLTELLEGTLEPAWASWSEFLTVFFSSFPD